MNPTWPLALRRQVQVLLDQFLAGGGNAWIGVAGIERFGLGQRFPSTLRAGGRLEALGDRPLARAFVWIQGTDAELWVDPADAGYRDLYDAFARAHLGLPGRPAGAGFNIDHVFPKAAGVLDGLSHVRVLAIGESGNQAAGRTVEKVMKRRAEGAPSGKVVRHATWMTIGKAAGFDGWEALPDDTSPAANVAAVRRLFGHLAAMGITAPLGVLEQRLTAHSLTRIH